MAEVWSARPLRPAAGMHAKAARAEEEGRWGDAVAALEELVRLQGRVVQHRVRLAYALGRAGRPRAAVDTYFEAAQLFVKDGYPEKGIACCHMARTICRHDERVDALLRELRARRDARKAAPEEDVVVQGEELDELSEPLEAAGSLDLSGAPDEGMPLDVFEQIYCRTPGG